MDNRREPVRATDEQLDRWEKHVRETLHAKQQAADRELEQRHTLESEKSQSEKTARRHGEEKAAQQQRKRRELDALEQRIGLARERRLIPDQSHGPAHTCEEIDQWAD